MTTALQDFRNSYQNGLSAPALPSDPLITQSTLTASLASRAATGANTDITSLLGVNGQGVDFRASEASIQANTVTDIGSLNALRAVIVGVNTITSFGSTPNAVRFVRFTAALTLTYNAISLVLPTAANITTAAGDSALLVSDASANWTVLVYQKASGEALKGSAGGGGSGSSGTVQRSIYRYVATANQTMFSGGDTAANVLSYTAGYVDVYYNGRLLSTTNFTASNGTSVVFANGAAQGDEILIITYVPVAIQNGVQRNIFRFVAATNQTSFSGADINNATLGYTPGACDVYWNGRFLSSVDFTATDGKTIVLGASADQGDEIQVVSQATITLANAVSTGTQTLLAAQRSQVRTNIAAAASGINGDISALYGISGAGIDLRASESSVNAGATTDLGSVSTLRVVINGAATIGSFGLLTNGMRLLRFAGACTLAYNATSLILPNATNITTAAGDTALVVSDASGNWRVMWYMRATGASLNGSSGSGGPTVRNVFRFVATANQSTFTGADASGNTLAYSVGAVDVYVNGRLLSPANITALNGTSIAVASTISANDEVVVIAYSAFTVANAVTLTTQTLTSAQQQTVQSNIGVAPGAGQAPGTGGRLTVTSNTALTYIRYNGNQIYISGANRTIPSAGIAMTNAGLTYGTLYYVYLYMNGSTITAEFSTTGHVTDTGSGIEIKNGDSSRTLIGMVYLVNSSGTAVFQDNNAARLVASYYNRSTKSLLGAYGGYSTASTTNVELSAGARATFLSWSDEAVVGTTTGQISFGTTSSGFGLYSRPSVDGDNSCPASLGGYTAYGAGTVTDTYVWSCSEGYHYLTIQGYVNTAGSTGTFTGTALGTVRS